MQSYPISFNRQKAADSFNVAGDLFVYESGTLAEYTNIALYSDSLDNSAWAVDAGVLVERQQIPTDGTATAWKLTKTAAGYSNLSQLAPILNDSERYIFQLRVMKDAVQNRFPEFFLRLQGGTSTSEAYIQVNTQTGVSVVRFSTGGETVMVIDAGAHWHIALSVPNNGTGNTIANFGMRVAFGTVLGALDLNALGSITVFGVMCNKGSLPSPNIITQNSKLSAATGDNRIIVKPDNGAEIILRPGQRFRIAENRASVWSVRTADGKTEIKGQVIIGSGEFDDANTLNAFTFDTKSGAIPTTVQNAVTLAGGEIEVKNDSGAPLSTSDAQVYASTFTSNGESQVGLQVVAPAANVNGLIVHRATWIVSNNANTMTLQAKNGVPASFADGDIIAMQAAEVPSGGIAKMEKSIKIPAGKGLYFYSGSSHTAIKQVLYTLL